MLQYYHLQKMDDLAVVLFQIYQVLNECENKLTEKITDEQQTQIDGAKSKLWRKVELLFSELAQTNLPGLLNLCYELIKIEGEKKEKFVYGFLNGNIQPQKLVEIICSNSYNKMTDKMVPDPNKFFRLVVKQDSFLKYSQNSDGINALTLGNLKEKGKMKKQSDKFQFTLTNN